MAIAQTPASKGPFTKGLMAPFTMNQDDALSALGPGEYVLLESFIEHQKQLWPIIPIAGQEANPSSGDEVVASFAIPNATQQNIFFTNAGKMYYGTVSVPGSATLTEITAASGSTDISSDNANNHLFSIAFVDGNLYFAHDGKGPLRYWGGGATYADVPAPASGYHSGVQYEPYYLTAQNNALILLGDASADGTPYDVVGSTVTNAQDFVSFGAFYTQMLDTSDVISGGTILASKLTIYKLDSIIIGTPTGDASSPYSFERYQQSTEQSIGCFAPYSLQNDGGFRDIFLSRYGMVMFDGTSFTFCGKGVDNALMGLSQLGSGGGVNSTTPAQATLGTIYTQGTAFASGSQPIPELRSTNKPMRFYALLPQPGTGLNQPIWLMNADTMQWYMWSYGGFGVGTMFVANTDSNGNTAPAAQKCIVSGSARLSFPSICQGSFAQPGNAPRPTIKIGCGPEIYQLGSENMKTVMRVGLELQQSPGLVQSAFSATLSLDLGGDMSNGAINNSQAYGANSVTAVVYPAVTAKYTPFFAWVDVLQTSRTPLVVIQFPLDTTARCWPRISRIAVQYDWGDDQ